MKPEITPGGVHPSAYENTQSWLWVGRWRAAWRWGYRPAGTGRPYYSWLWTRGLP